MFRAPRWLAAAFIALPLTACAGVDRVAFLATTGERPADRTRFVEIDGPNRLGKSPPVLLATRYAPEPVPGAGKKDEKAAVARISGPVEGATAAYAKTRRALVNIDDGFHLRRQSLRLYSGEYLAAARRITLQHGDPLPANPAALNASIAAMRKALGAMRGDLLKMHNILIRLDGAGLQAMAQAAQAAAIRPTAAGDAKRLADLKIAYDKSIAKARALAIQGRKEIGSYVEYLSGQESSLARLEDQIKNARPLAAK